MNFLYSGASKHRWIIWEGGVVCCPRCWLARLLQLWRFRLLSIGQHVPGLATICNLQGQLWWSVPPVPSITKFYLIACVGTVPQVEIRDCWICSLVTGQLKTSPVTCHSCTMWCPKPSTVTCLRSNSESYQITWRCRLSMLDFLLSLNPDMARTWKWSTSLGPWSLGTTRTTQRLVVWSPRTEQDTTKNSCSSGGISSWTKFSLT